MSDAKARIFWAVPLRQFVFDNRTKILACITEGELPLPGKCCRCGSSQTKPHPVKVKPTPEDAKVHAAIALLGGHIAHGIMELVNRKVGIPCCASCRRLRWGGYTVAFALTILGLIPFIRICMMNQTAKLHTAFSTEVVGVIAMFLFPALGVGIAAWCSWHSLPVVIYAVKDGYLYFEFWSAQYQKLLVNVIPPSNTAA